MTVSDRQIRLGHRALLPSTKRVSRMRSLLWVVSDSILPSVYKHHVRGFARLLLDAILMPVLDCYPQPGPRDARTQRLAQPGDLFVTSRRRLGGINRDQGAGLH